MARIRKGLRPIDREREALRHPLLRLLRGIGGAGAPRLDGVHPRDRAVEGAAEGDRLPQPRGGGSIRDHALLSILYDSGARVSEISSAKRADLRAGSPASIRLLGKGSKVRVVPLCSQAAGIGARYLSEVPGGPEDPLFRNRDGDPVGRAGIAWLLSKYVSMAHDAHPGLVPARVHPHMLRHSKAMHLLESGVNIVYIRDFLGHSSVTTTEVYARASMKAKREAIEKASAKVMPESAYTPEERSELLEWLKALL